MICLTIYEMFSFHALTVYSLERFSFLTEEHCLIYDIMNHGNIVGRTAPRSSCTLDDSVVSSNCNGALIVVTFLTALRDSSV